jgi:hypothetical protein
MWTMPKVYQYLARLGLEEQGVGYTPERFLRDHRFLLLECIAA